MPNDNVDLDDYLWGGAEVTVQGYYMAINGQRVGGFMQGAPQFFALSSNVSLRTFLANHGVPEKAIQPLIAALVATANYAFLFADPKTGRPHELLFAIGLLKNGNVALRKARSVETDYCTHVENFLSAVQGEGINILLWGHIHTPDAIAGLSDDNPMTGQIGDRSAAREAYLKLKADPKFAALADKQVAITNGINGKDFDYWDASTLSWYGMPLQ
jgi:hypothetical protein